MQLIINPEISPEAEHGQIHLNAVTCCQLTQKEDLLVHKYFI